MLVFGVTGGIGSGKTEVCRLLAARNIPIIAADPMARDLTASSAEIRKDLSQRFGAEVYEKDGSPNIGKLSELVFSGPPETRAAINAIIHPHVFRKIQDELQAHRRRDERFVAVEAALIFESGMDKVLDRVVVVDAPQAKRMEWIAARNRLTPEEALQRIRAQMPVEEKITRADYVVANSGDLRALSDSVNKLLLWLEAQ